MTCNRKKPKLPESLTDLGLEKEEGSRLHRVLWPDPLFFMFVYISVR